jgi:hypothetical protein
MGTIRFRHAEGVTCSGSSPDGKTLIRPAEALRSLRSFTLLEWIGSPEARAILDALALGSDAAPETREAKAALARLGRHR